ncbi:hypothetical protein PJM47_03880 [Mycobacterium kansasii]
MARQWQLTLVVAASFGGGIIGLLIDTAGGALVWCALIGLGQGGGLSLALTLFSMRCRAPESVAQLSGMAQTIGYMIGACGPVAMGYLHDLTGQWTAPLLILLSALVPYVMAGIALTRDGYIEDCLAVGTSR